MSYRLTIAQAVLLIGLCLLVAGTAMADGTVERQTAVKLYRGSRIIAASDPNSSVHVAGLTPKVCEVMREERWQEEAATRTTGSATYKCQVEARAIVEFHPAPTCPERSAEQTDGQLRQTCPAGTVGVWLQDRTWTLRPYPDCWVQGDWLPVEPPAGMCAPIEATPPANRAPTISGEAPAAATVGELYSFTPTASDPDGDNMEFRIGSRPAWMAFDWIAGRISGTPTAVGTVAPITIVALDNRGGTAQLRTPTIVISAGEPAPPPDDDEPPAPPTTGTASLSWTPPMHNTDGSAAVITGYTIHYGPSPDALTNVISTSEISYRVTGLLAGAHYFAVRAVASYGVSDLSNTATKVVR